jgi:hypothetical protein
LLLADAGGEAGKSFVEVEKLLLDPPDQCLGKPPAGPGRQCLYQAHQDEAQALGRAEGGGIGHGVLLVYFTHPGKRKLRGAALRVLERGWVAVAQGASLLRPTK